MMRAIRISLMLLIGVTTSLSLKAQIHGQVTDNDGLPLAYVSVFVQGTSIGTVTNLDGIYSFEPSIGTQQIVFQYIGYKTVVKEVEYSSIIEVNTILAIESYNLDEVVVSANGENPAISIIKNAIKKRSFYHKQINRYEVDLYAKGMVKMLDAPTKILGEEIGNMDGMLDSTNQGIVYLSESQSKIYFRAPNELKEIMHSSKVAESDNAFNSNMLSNAYFNIYEEYYNFGSTILSPIGDNALLYYNYKLEGASINSEGHLVNKITVIPKSNSRPLFFGNIYIVNDSWHISELELQFTGKSVKSSLLDTISIKQIYFEAKEDSYVVLHQVMSFSMKLFGFEMAGDFTHVFSNYNMDIEFDKNVFSSETFKMSEEAFKNDTSFWSLVRPIPLTTEERLEYIRKDSLKLVWKSIGFISIKKTKIRIYMRWIPS